MVNVDRIFYINLKHRVDRRVRIEKLLTDRGYINNSELFCGFEPKFKYGGIYDRRLAAIRSHIGVIKKAYEMKLENVMIIEDDCVFYDELYDNFNFKNIDELLNDVDNKYELLYIGFYFHTDGTILEEYNDGIDKIITTPFEGGLECYVVNIPNLVSRMCKVYGVDVCYYFDNFIDLHDVKFVNPIGNSGIRGISLHVNVEGLYNYTLLNRYCTNPVLATQHAGFSDIEQIDYDGSADVLQHWRELKKFNRQKFI